MDNTKYISLSRQMGLWKQMDIVSNNMANMNTSGFKSQDALFRTYVAQTVDAKGFGRQPVHFTQDFAAYKDFSEGQMVETGNPLDMAIKGNAFFAVETADGEKYTRKGQFHLDSDRKIVTGDGLPVLSEGNAPIFIAPTELEIYISETGEVSTENGIIGRLKLVNFSDDQKLLKIADTLFENTFGNVMTLGANESTIHQGLIEKSNVNSITEMTKLINLQRSYEYVQQMIDNEHTRLSKAIDVFSQIA